MSYYDNMIERFDAGKCVIGFLDSGTIVVDRYERNEDGYFPFANAIQCLQDPELIAPFIARAKEGDASVVGYYKGMNVAGLEIGDNVLIAELDLPDDSYTDEMTFAQFDPILTAWQKAWAAAQEYRTLHKV